MKKSTLNAIMQGVIIVLVIAIVFVSIRLVLRPDIVEEEPISEVASEPEQIVEEVSEPEPEVVVEERVRIVNDNINVRSGPGTDFDRLGSAYNGYDFEFVEQLEEGWTKIIYDGQMAYVYSEYVEIIPMVLDEEGNYTEYVNLEDSSADIHDEGDVEADTSVSSEDDRDEASE